MRARRSVLVDHISLAAILPRCLECDPRPQSCGTRSTTKDMSSWWLSSPHQRVTSAQTPAATLSPVSIVVAPVPQCTAPATLKGRIGKAANPLVRPTYWQR